MRLGTYARHVFSSLSLFLPCFCTRLIFPVYPPTSRIPGYLSSTWDGRFCNSTGPGRVASLSSGCRWVNQRLLGFGPVAPPLGCNHYPGFLHLSPLPASASASPAKSELSEGCPLPDKSGQRGKGSLSHFLIIITLSTPPELQKLLFSRK